MNEEQKMRQEITRLEERLKSQKASMAKLAGFIRPGMPVWYEARPGVRHAAVVAGEPAELGEGQIVVALRELDESYAAENGKTTVKAAATWCLEPRVPSSIDNAENDAIGASFAVAKGGTGGMGASATISNTAAGYRNARSALARIVSAIPECGPIPRTIDDRYVDDVIANLALAIYGDKSEADGITAVHEAHQILNARRAGELLTQWRAVSDLTWTGPAEATRFLVRDTIYLLEDLAGIERPSRSGELVKAITHVRKVVYALALEIDRSIHRDVQRAIEDLIMLIPYAPLPPMGPPLAITEEDGYQKGWMTVRPENLAELAGFVDTLCNQYKHDIGTVVHAMAAAALATARTVAKHMEPRMGKISGGFAGFVPILFVRHFLNIQGPFGIRRYEDMLYPQNAGDFRTINLETFRWLQEQAKEQLDLHATESAATRAAPEVIAHWQRIVDGEVPFGFQIKD